MKPSIQSNLLSSDSRTISPQSASSPVSTQAENPPLSSATPHTHTSKPRRPVPTDNGSTANALPESTLPADQVLAALKALKRGDFEVRLAGAWTGVSGQVADTFNELAAMLAHSTEELSRVSRLVGKEGKIQERLSFGQATAGWAERVNSINALIDWLTHPVSETVRIIDAVCKGDLSRNMSLEIDGRKLEGEFLRTSETVNRMVHQLRTFASEVNRVSREVGTEGKLGGQARVPGVAGSWKDLTDNVNLMAGNLTS